MGSNCIYVLGGFLFHFWMISNSLNPEAYCAIMHYRPVNKYLYVSISHVFQILEGPILYLDSQAIIQNLIPGN